MKGSEDTQFVGSSVLLLRSLSGFQEGFSSMKAPAFFGSTLNKCCLLEIADLKNY